MHAYRPPSDARSRAATPALLTRPVGLEERLSFTPGGPDDARHLAGHGQQESLGL
eukprot:GDKH01018565.1.p3 GENE.GDKH01018565.1~~GDKH01018565.1.p3  ORF type:complete len:55 (-),score=7.25 GDKH01018565.1:48-212(-)